MHKEEPPSATTDQKTTHIFVDVLVLFRPTGAQESDIAFFKSFRFMLLHDTCSTCK